MENKKFAKIIKTQRAISGYNQTQAAKMLYLTRSSYQHYEAGTRTPSLETVIRMGALYNIHPVDLISSLVPTEISDKIPGYIETLYCGKYAFTSDDMKIIRQYNSLSDSDKDMIKYLLRLISTK